MTLGNRIGQYRRKLGLTQEALAKRLDVTNQAVSKWESDQCCPDIALLPKIADIFEITLDELFGREASTRSRRPEAKPEEPTAAPLPWADDGTLRVVLFVGHQLIAGHPARDRIEFCYEGPALNVSSECAVSCDHVKGNVTAGGDVSCDYVGGSVQAQGNVNCETVNGDIHAGADVSCDEVNGSVIAGRDVSCDEVHGNVKAGGDVSCDNVDGDIQACGDVTCDCVEGNVTAGVDVNCDEVNGNVSAGRDVVCDEINGEATASGQVRSGESGDKANITIHLDDEEDSGIRITIGPDGKVKLG